MAKTIIKNKYYGPFYGSSYGLGFIGAAVYYVVQATSFWMGVLGILKAFVWPAFLIYGLFKYLGL